LLLLCSNLQEPSSGIYVVNVPAKKVRCERELRMVVGNSKVCVPQQPIIDISEIAYVTDIQYNPKIQAHYVDIGITSSGMKTLRRMADSLTEPKFALVIDNKVVCIFSSVYGYSINSIRIGDDASWDELRTIHDALSGLKN